MVANGMSVTALMPAVAHTLRRPEAHTGSAFYFFTLLSFYFSKPGMESPSAVAQWGGLSGGTG